MPPHAETMFRAMSRHVRGPLGVVYRHPRAFRRLLLRALAAGSDETNALIRTTRVVTLMQGAAAANVLPESARAAVNLRVAVGSTLEAEVERLRRDIADPQVSVNVVYGSEPAPVSPASGPAWDRLVDALAVSHPDAVALPYGMLGATDGRHFCRISPAVYRFTPFAVSKRELHGLHAVDESLPVDEWLAGIRFYRALLDSC
jgi:carboxypeptidase PM20D1